MAADRSSIARPSDSKIVISAGVHTALTGCGPGEQFADLGADVIGPDGALGGREQVVA